MWAFKSLWDKGLIYEGFRVLAYCWRCETPLSNTETRMDDVYRDRQDPALTVGFELLDGPWAGARLLAWTTTPWTLPANLALAVGPDIDYAVVERDGSALRARRRAPRRLRRRARPTPTPVGHRARRRPRRGAATGRCSTSSPTPSASAPSGVPGARRRLRVHRGRHRHRPPGAGLRRGRPGGLQRRRHPDARADGRARPLHRRGRRRGRRARLRRQPARHPPPQGRRRRRCATRPTTTPTRTAGAAPQPLVYRAISSWFVEVTKFRDRMVELNEQITWVPEHLKHGSFGKWLENARDWSISRNRFWGSPIPVWRSDDPAYPRVDVYGSLAELEADFGVAGHRPPPADGRRARAAQPRRPDRALDDAARARGARLLVRVGLDAVRPGALPVREPGVVREPLPGRLHRRVHRPDPRLVLHAARAGHGAVRPPGVPDLRQPRHRARRRRAEDVQEPAQLPGPDGGVRQPRRRRHALVPAVVADPARQRLLGDGGRAARHRPPGAAAAVERVVLPRPVRQRRRLPGAACAPPDEASEHVLDRYVLAKTRQLVDEHDGGDGRLRPVRRVRPGAVVRRRADQLVHPPQPPALLGRRPRRHRHAAHRARRRSCGSPRRCCRTSPRRSTTGCTTGASGDQRAPARLAVASTSCRPTTSWSRRWTRSATCARRRCRCARPTAAGCASRWPR